MYDMIGTFRTSAEVMYDATSCVRIIDPLELPEDARSLLPEDDRRLQTEMPKLNALSLTEENKWSLFQAVVRTVFALRQHGDKRWPNVAAIISSELLPQGRMGQDALDDVLR